MNHFRAEFEKEISRKTGWGKNEIMNTFDQVSTRALLKAHEDRDEDDKSLSNIGNVKSHLIEPR